VRDDDGARHELGDRLNHDHGDRHDGRDDHGGGHR
jgi:hypothetical protein